MKKRKLTAVIIILIILSITACTKIDYDISQDKQNVIINAESYQGIMFDCTTLFCPPLDLPDITRGSTETAANTQTTLDSETVTNAATTAFGEAIASEEEDYTSTVAVTSKAVLPPVISKETEFATEVPVVTTDEPVISTTSHVEITTRTTEITNIVTEDVPTNNSYKPLNYAVTKGVWLSYIDLTPMIQGKSEEEFTKNIAIAFKNCTNKGLNTVYVHARAFGDAFYKSTLFPLSNILDEDISYDPLKIMVQEAHKNGLSFQCWINPLRIDLTNVSEQYQTAKWYNNKLQSGKYIVKIENLWYLNPAYNDVIDFVADGVTEIVSGYDVDGIHIDDYFYPTTDTSFDKEAFTNSGIDSLYTFRLANSSKLVKKLYDAVKSVNSAVLFGVSPQGSIENDYNTVYADVKKWCKEPGYLDYIAPQIYYGYDNAKQPYSRCLSEWQELVSSSGVPIITGLAAYKVGEFDKYAGAGGNEWLNRSDILSRQVSEAEKLANYGGVIYYSYNSLFNNKNSSMIQTELQAIKYTK